MIMDFLLAAAEYVPLGFKVIPLVPRTKLPLVRAWQRQGSDELSAITEWAHKWPSANIGVVTGHPSDVVVIDLDVKDGRNGMDTMARLAGAGKTLPPSPIALTPTGGRHLYFRMAAGLKNLVGMTAGGRGLGPGVDVRATGGFVVAPPSKLQNGSYRWLVPPMAPDFPRLPDWAIQMLKPPAAKASNQAFVAKDAQGQAERSLEGMARRLAAAAAGGRNNLLNWAAFTAGELVRDGKLAAPAVEARLVQAGLAAGLALPEVKATIASGLRAAMQSGGAS